MFKQLPILGALLVVLIAPIALRPKSDQRATSADRTLVVITPHNEAIRYEFSQAFARWYRAKTGKTVHVDYRTPGGTSEITRYVDSEFLAAFENYWVRVLGKPWSSVVERAFSNPKIKLDE